MTEGGSEAERLAGEIEKVKEQASRNILSVIVDMQDVLTTKMIDSPEKTSADVVNNALASFFDSDPQFISAVPRRIREQDRVKILPGQHAGFTIQFGLKDGNILRINIYGGLRTFANADMRDSDLTMKHSHTQRTDTVLSQPTMINWHIKRPDENQTTLCDVWLKKTQTNFILDKIYYDGEKIDIMANANSDSYGFKKISESLGKSIGDITKVIPSNY